MQYLTFIFLAIFISLQVNCIEEDYFWRDYNGVIPSDAIIAGKDAGNLPIYIAQGYVKDGGLVVGELKEGDKEIKVCYRGIKKVPQKQIKVLCGHQQNFQWIPASHDDLHLTLIGKHAVIGGHEDNNGYYNIGRISHGGTIRVGKVNSFQVNDAAFLFEDQGKEQSVKAYEILIHVNKRVDIRSV